MGIRPRHAAVRTLNGTALLFQKVGGPLLSNLAALRLWLGFDSSPKLHEGVSLNES